MSGSSRARSIPITILKTLLAIAFFAAGAAKLAGVPMMIQLFDQIGLGQWFRYATAIVEIGGAAALLVPRLTGAAALTLAITMTVAVLIHISVLHTNPAPAAILLILCSTLAWVRREDIRRFGA